MKKVKDLPEIDRLGDDGMVLCSQDEQHLSKIKRKHLTSNGGNGGLLYWKETEDKIYNERDVVPFNQDSVIVEIDDGFDGMYHNKHFEVFGKSFPYVVQDPNGRKRALKQAKGYGIVSTDGYVDHIPSGYLFQTQQNQTGFNFEYTYDEIMDTSSEGWHEKWMNKTYIPWISCKLNSNHTKFIGTVTLNCQNEYGDIWVGNSQVLEDADPGIWDPSFSNATATTTKTNGVREADEYNTYSLTSCQFIFILSCSCQTNYSDPTNYDNYNITNISKMCKNGSDNGIKYTRYMENLGSITNAYGETFGVWTYRSGGSIGEYIVDRAPANTAEWTDDNGIIWDITMLPAHWLKDRIVPEDEGQDAYWTNYDLEFPEFEKDFDELTEVDLGTTHNHWSYYPDANPQDTDEPSSYGNYNLSLESQDIYATNLIQLGKDIMEALGIRSYKGILPDEIPEDMSYKTRASMQVTDDFTAFSAGLVDINDVYEEKFRVDAKNGDIYENGQKLSEKYAPVGSSIPAVLPFSATAQKIGTWIDGRDVYRVAYYEHNNSSKSTKEFTLATMPYSDNCTVRDAIVVGSTVMKTTTAASTTYLPLPLNGTSSSSYGTSYGHRCLTAFVDNGDSTCDVVLKISVPTYGAGGWSYYGLMAVIDFVV